MVVAAIERGDVQRHGGVHGEGLEPFLHQLGVESSHFVAHEFDVEHQERPAGNVDGDPGQRLVHRHVHVGVTGDTLHVAERLPHRLAERDTDILGGVVVVDVQVALGLDRDVEARMPGQEVKHVIEETDTGRDRRTAAAVEIDGDLDVGFLGGTFDGRLAHHVLRAALLSGLGAPRQCPAADNCIAGRQLLNHGLNQGFPAHVLSPEPGQSGLWRGTTILTVRKGGVVAVGGDGQVSIGQTIVKANARKVRRLGSGEVIGGFAGATADAFTLFERLEAKLEQYRGQLMRAAVELAKDWRTDRYLRRLEAMMIVADKDVSLVLTGTGDVLEPEAGIVGIGSGGNYALAAARALIDGPLDAETIVRRALDIAADICVYTNRNVTVETLKT